jgi:hypothetical protein
LEILEWGKLPVCPQFPHDKIMLEDLAKMGLGDEELAKG